jgi:aspartyl-tRNA(Asn)/glutamyl-tRNA(Gln) amidotransferase subunit A
VAVAAGMAVAALGGDAGGSIRAPAAWCGVAGLRPTLGIVPGGGATSLSPTIDTIGPMARHSSDVLSVLDVIADLKHGRGLSRDELSGKIPDGTEILVPSRLLHDLCDDEVAAACESGAKWFAAAGASVRSLEWPVELLIDSRQAVMSLIAAESSTRLGHLDPNLLGDDVRAVIARGRALGPQAIEQIRGVVERLGRLLGDCLDAGAMVLTPVWPCDPPPAGGGPVCINGRPHAYDEVRSLFTATASLLGLPQAVFNAAFSCHGLPIGLQLLGKRYSDAVLLSLAAAFENANDHSQRRPAAT